MPQSLTVGRRAQQALHVYGKAAWAAALAVLVLLSALWWVFRAGPTVPVITVGIVQLTAVDSATVAGFKARMTELGYEEGRDVRYRYPGPAETIARLEPIIADHLEAGVDLLFVSSTPATVAAQRATRGTDIPVVFAPVNDPVKAGVVASLQSPGGNITGVQLPQGDGIRLQWLLKVAPSVSHILFPHNPNDQSALESLSQIQEVSSALGIQLTPQPVPTSDAIVRGLRELPRSVDAVLLPRDSFVESHIADYVRLSLDRKIPLCAPSLTQVDAGALLSYGFVHFEIGRQAARLAHQILSGVRPADLPVESARSYLAVNIKTADAIGLAVAPEILRNAHVIVR